MCPPLMLPNDFGSVCDEEGFVILRPIRIFTESLKLCLYEIINDLPLGRRFGGRLEGFHASNECQGSK
jgi:hypothetical protein